MKVKELIEKLKTFDPELEVYTWIAGLGGQEIACVEEVKGTVYVGDE